MLLNPFIGVNSVGSSGVSYFFEERFEANPGYTNTWDETGGTGTIDEDYTGDVLEGSQSLRLVASTQHPLTSAILPSDQGELWFFCKFKLVTAITTTRRVIGFLDSGDVDCGGVNIVVTTNVLQAKSGTLATSTVDAVSVGTTYNLWCHMKKSTGAGDGICTVGFSTSGTEPTSGNAFASRTTGNSTADFHKINCRITTDAGTNSTGEIIFDQILISTTGTIGDNPA